MFFVLLLLGWLAFVGLIDLKDREVGNKFCWFGFWISLISVLTEFFYSFDYVTLLWHFTMLLVGYVIGLTFYKQKWWGGADVRVLSFVSFYVGKQWLDWFLYFCIAATIYSLLYYAICLLFLKDYKFKNWKFYKHNKIYGIPLLPTFLISVILWKVFYI